MRLKQINHHIDYLRLDGKNIIEQNELMVKMLRKKYEASPSKYLILDFIEIESIDHNLVCFVLDVFKLLAYRPQNLILIDPNDRFSRHLAILHLNIIIESFKNYEEAVNFIESKVSTAVMV
ncbi:hypothetical protein [Fusibacter ferrireducens]|uniref:STAS domain-containing protein n=1 Tax=Fusibacter ferrireducens TaxID=2785058 RepID=A0ABR9ZV52_9FIRM|nr:hypothetical protein [Fusibacter ferrireducens]MBF4694337.1 hypothetical protein [Fusibacter ferrireducens]